MLRYYAVILHALKLTFAYYLLLSTYSIYSFGSLSVSSYLHTVREFFEVFVKIYTKFVFTNWSVFWPYYRCF